MNYDKISKIKYDNRYEIALYYILYDEYMYMILTWKYYHLILNKNIIKLQFKMITRKL